MIEVRLATVEELPLVIDLMLEAFEEYMGVLYPPSGAFSETLETATEGMSNGGAVLAFLDENAVGSSRFCWSGDFVYFGRMAVVPSARRQGVGGAMLEFVYALAKERGVSAVRLSTREVMESNIRMYLRHGYELERKSIHPAGEGIVLEFVKHVR